MAPKAAKKGAAAKKTAAAVAAAAAQGSEVQTWESELANALFHEDHWQACVCVLVGRGPRDEELIRTLARAVRQPQRKLFTSLSWEDTEAKIREYGNPKAKKRDAFPQFYQVTEPARELLEAREEIPAQLMAQVVKFMLLQIKESDQQRRKAEQAKAAAPVAKEKPGPKGKAKKPKDEPALKPKSKLKRRDDVEPPKFINDEPSDGPHHYVLLLGFHQPQLVGTLDGAGVHVANVIRLSAAAAATVPPDQVDEETADAADEIAAREARAAQAKVLDRFWGALRHVLDNGGPNSRLHDVAQLEYAVPDSLMPFDPQDPEAAMAAATQMFDGVSNLIYDCLEWRRQHRHYLDSANFIRVPSVVWGQDAPPPAETTASVSPHSKKSGRPPAPKKPPSSLTTDVDMNHYAGLLEQVPAEACSVALILHCMLEQVCASLDFGSAAVPPPPPPAGRPLGPSHHPCTFACVQVAVSSEQAPDDGEPQTALDLDRHALGRMLHKVLPQVHAEDERRDLLCSLLSAVEREEDKQMLKEEFGAEETPRRRQQQQQQQQQQPVIVRHHDERARRFIGVTATPSLDPAQEEASVMRRSPAWQLIDSVARRRCDASCWRVVKQQLQRQCTGDEVSWPQAEHFFQRSVLESMLLSQVEEDGVLGKDCRALGMAHQAKEQPVIPWDDPLSFAKHKFSNLRRKCPPPPLKPFSLCAGRRAHPPLLVSAAAGPTFLQEEEQISERESAERESAERESAERESAERESAERESAERESAERESAERESAERESAERESAERESAKRLDLRDIQSCRRRCLRDWDYVERHEAGVFPQVLHSAAQRYRCVDTHRGSHNNVLYVFCHNPMSPDRLCKEFWDVAIHTDVKFRTFKEHVADTIADWLEKEELKKQLSASDRTSSAAQASESLPEEDDESREQFVTGSSLKAAKLEEDKLKEEEGKKGKKPAKAATGKKQQPAENAKSTETKKSDKSAVGKSKAAESSSTAAAADAAPPSTADDKEEAGGSGFAGFHMDGMLVHLSGSLQYLFPAAGGHVTVETISYVEGSSMLKVAVSKDGHRLYTHVDRALTRNGGKEHPVRTAAATRRSFSALLDSGVRLAYTFEGPAKDKGKASDGSLKEPEEESTSKGDGAEQPRDSPSSRTCPPPRPLAGLSLSIPSGLLVQFMRQDGEPSVLVRLSFHATGRRGPALAKEASRTVTAQGTVIRYMRDGSSQVLFADGTVSSSLDSGPVWVPEAEEDTTDEQNPENQPASPPRGYWATTTPCGTRICTVGSTHEQSPACALLSYVTSDPVTHEVMLSREDLVVTVKRPDGSVSVDHADGTRITTFYRDRPGSAAEEGGREKVVAVENEACATVLMYPERHVAEIWLADGTVVTSDNQGAYQVVPSSIGLLRIQSDGKCVYSSGALRDGRPAYIMSPTDKVACDVTDVDGNHFQVSQDGQVSVRSVGPAPRTLQEDDEDEDKDGTGGPRDHSPRLFLVHEDGSGSELMSSRAVSELLKRARSDPAAAVLKDPLPDSPGEFGITVLKPGTENVRSKWVHVKLDPNAIHQSLRNRSGRDCAPFETTHSPPFGSTAGQGPGLKKLSGGGVLSCPKVLEIREVQQHRAFGRQLRDTVDTWLKEYIESLMEKASWSADATLKEPRGEVERAHAGLLLSQSFAEEPEHREQAKGGAAGAQRSPGDMGVLYGRAVHAALEPSGRAEDPAVPAGAGRTQLQVSKWTDTLEQYRQELLEVKARVDALRKRIIVPYFHPENDSLREESVDLRSRPNGLPVPPLDSLVLFFYRLIVPTPRGQV
ncbi:sperm-associated antigen 17-like isoform X2 [Syngnathus typhle]|uniref:sperm-associated antigen 17-like isoform X2 n=1 Tax=Syngnathus typhle TaxID=161592 RepID=UPI002A6B4E0F|nr:sperm-associated antigen 17-like isoform X2 [Syngnathus typhle]